MLEKDEARKLGRAGREGMSAGERQRAGDSAARRLISLLGEADRVLCFASLPLELGTDALLRGLWSRGVRTALPRVEGREMHFYEVRAFSDLAPGAMGIREPAFGEHPVRWPGAPAVTPGLAFDGSGGRAGYGGGYYDRFFAREPDHAAIGYCFDRQVLEEEILLDVHDRRMDWIVTESRVIDCGKRRR